jgi:hypothetical protein
MGDLTQIAADSPACLYFLVIIKLPILSHVFPARNLTEV